LHQAAALSNSGIANGFILIFRMLRIPFAKPKAEHRRPAEVAVGTLRREDV